MSRYTKTAITQLSANEQAAIDAINKNLTDIQTAIADTVSRSGNTPTHMTADLDLNGQRILNVPAPTSGTDLVRQQDVVEDINMVQQLVNTATNAAAQALASATAAQEVLEDSSVVLVAEDLALDDSSNIKIVAGDKANIDAVAGNKTNIDTVASISSNITTVAGMSSNISSVVSNATNINAVAGDQTNIDAVAGNLTNINSVVGNATNINAVNSNKTNIDTVATNVSDVNTVAGSIANVNTVAASDANIGTVATNISDVNDCADNMAAIVDAPNQAQAAADSAALAYQYGNDKINQTHITNCITYIPQDIKLELNNGTLTLKAGSKVYVPNGSGVFDIRNITSDVTLTQGWGSSDTFLLTVRLSDGALRIYDTARCYSGTSSVSDGMYYNTNDNKVYVYDNGSLNYQASFPIAVITGQSPTITRIDQVFNGFGYIGSTVFALPGVKGLIPNGRNADGTLNSQEFTVNTVLTTTDVSSATGGLEYYVSDLGINRVNFGQYTYNEQKNKTLDSSGNRIVAVLLDANAHRTSGKVDSFNTRAVFHAVDYFDIVKYSDKKTVVGWGMPDYSAAVSISLPYTPTKDGYILRNVQNGYIHLRLTQSLVSYAGADNRFNSTMIPVSSGQTVSEYLSGGTYEMYFIPCKGE